MNEVDSRTRSIREGRSDAEREITGPMSGAAKNNEIDPLLHPPQVAKLLGLSTSWLAKARMDGYGPRYTKIGRAVRYSLSAVGEFIKSRQRNSTSEQPSSTSRRRKPTSGPRKPTGKQGSSQREVSNVTRGD
jgi:predicted DNA-binding transcriptional regulator AlpA